MSEERSGAPKLPGAGIPTDEEGPVFSEPWQARIFGIVVHLCEAQGIPWKEWADHFSRELADAAGPDSDRDPAAYYERWLSAAESWLADRGLVEESQRSQVKDQILADQLATRQDHDH